VREW